MKMFPVCRNLLGALLLFTLFHFPAEALLAKSGPSLYVSASYGSFLAGRMNTAEVARPLSGIGYRATPISGEALMERSLSTFGGKIGLSFFGLNVEAEALYGRGVIPKPIYQPGEDMVYPLPKIYETPGCIYLLGMVNTNLEISGVTLFSPYIGVGLGVGSVLAYNPYIYEKDRRRYGFPVVAQFRTGLSLDLNAFSMPLKPYLGYRLLLITSVGTEEAGSAYNVITDGIDPHLNLITQAKEAISALRSRSHTSHNAEVGIKVYLS